MGDKSPKATQKTRSQKHKKEDASKKKKSDAVAAKAVSKTAPKPGKK